MGQAGAVLLKDTPQPVLVPGRPTGFFTEFPLYLDRMEMAGVTTEEAKIDLLDKCLPPAGHSWIQMRKEEAKKGFAPRLTYQELWAWVRPEYGGQEDQRSLLADIKALKPVNPGILTSSAWRDYTAEFRLILSRLTDRP